jgi:class 3 adenylate cyclase
MALTDELSQDVDSILRQEWNVREGQSVPKTEDVALTGGAVKLAVTMLYADLADSTDLAMNHDKRVAAKVFKSFLSCSSKLIRKQGGEIRSFDGDRVMGVFIGDFKNTNAAKCALKINYAFLKIIKPKLLAKYPSLETGSYKLAHCVGVDTSEVLVVRGGIRNNNDLVWVGRAPNVAAKLSAIRNSPYHSYITDSVFNVMTDEAKIGSDGRQMWEKRENSDVVKGVSTIYRSSWTWTP